MGVVLEGAAVGLAAGGLVGCVGSCTAARAYAKEEGLSLQREAIAGSIMGAPIGAASGGIAVDVVYVRQKQKHQN